MTVIISKYSCTIMLFLINNYFLNNSSMNKYLNISWYKGRFQKKIREIYFKIIIQSNI